jgi:hypothetical protein
MAAGDIYRKTARGSAEIGARKLKLNPRVRTMLVLIDGTRPELLVKEEARTVGAPPDFLEQLLALGLIERGGRTAGPAPAAGAGKAEEGGYEQFRKAKDFMNVTVVDALGIKSFFFTLKLERAGTVEDLRALVEPYRQAIAKSDEAQAEVLTARLQEMLR